MKPRARTRIKGTALLAAALLVASGVGLAASAAQADPTTCGTTDAAAGKVATASSVNGSNVAANAVDGNSGTRWESAQGHDPEWIQVDLGSSQGICSVTLNWEAAGAKDFTISTSQNSQDFTQVYSGTNATAGVHTVTFDTPVSGRFVRVTGTSRLLPYGYSLFDFNVYTTGPDGNDQALQPKACAGGTTGGKVPTNPGFGPNVTIIDPSWPVSKINQALAAAGGESEFSTNRHAVFFLPGTYGCADGTNGSNATFQQYIDGTTSSYADLVNGAVGYYEQVAGLGASPEDVTLNGAIHSDGQASHQAMPWVGGESALTNFWRSLSNVKINPIQKATDADLASANYAATDFNGAVAGNFPEGNAPAGQLTWAVSQAAPLRRVDVAGNLSLFPAYGGYSSGGYLANSKVSGQVISGSQQQWYTRDSSIGSWNGSVWNMTFSGVQGAPAQSFPTPPYTTLPTTPETRDAPFLYVTGNQYKVFVPKAGTNTSGVNWSTDASAGRSLPISSFFIARPSDSVQKINQALASGKNLLLTPGEYRYAQAIQVTRPDTVVLGLGLPTLVPTNGKAALQTDDVNGVVISGITVDAGAKLSPSLIVIGDNHRNGHSQASASDPTALIDVFVRVGGAEPGKTDTAIVVNSDHVILDDIWSWRADHGAGVGWTQNTANTGLQVNGDDVTALGLFVEHYQKNQVVWNGEGGTTVFYQSELPYDVPSQAAWTDTSGGASRNGYASYRVADSVRTHTAYGLGVYSFFNQGLDIVEDSAIQAPTRSGVQFVDMVTRFLNGNGSITHVIEGAGAGVRLAQPGEDGNAVETAYLAAYPGADKTPPVVTATLARNGFVTLTATDDFAAPVTILYRIDDGPLGPQSGWLPYTHPVRISGSDVLDYLALDQAGNASAPGSISAK